MPAYYAFFDVDGTILEGVSMLDFLQFYFNKKYANGKSKWMSQLHYNIYRLKAFYIKHLLRSRESLNRFYYQCYKNELSAELLELANEWFEKNIKYNEKSYKHSVIAELKKHQKNGAEIVFVSGSFEVCLLPLAKELKVKTILCTKMIIDNDRYTGGIDFPMIGQAKAQSLSLFFLQRGFEQRELCYAYGDHSSDMWMLKMVGNPRVVQGDKKLESWAKEKNIPILN